ncbi:riboflavin kinase [Orussus abietinus]|uniref:riboflavin kinase n=1 Tax=Orussus abietinus TaxID=222816 RepID=UPI00062649B3|nr:riboflavin kinase [Orussus abietinus]
MSEDLLPLFLSGKVVKGFGRGSKELGIPTANISDDAINNLPEELQLGVYFGWASLENKGIFKMVMNIGWCPYYKNEKKSLEIHLLNFFDDVYGKEIKFIITGYIRPEKEFSSIDELIKEIHNDIKIADEKLNDPKMIAYRDNPFL